jgi:hypothetical protein
MNDWRIGLSAWIIQDGNYGDFRCHERAEFALEFYPQNCQPSASPEKQARWLHTSKYAVNAKVIFVAKRCFVLDFGLLAYRQAEPPKSIRKGLWVQAEIYLGVDPFFYFEALAHVKGMPPLIYSWHINKISIETAPFIETVDARGTRMMVRDETKSGFQEIEQTDAWNDDNGHGDYVLECTLMDVPPKPERR